MSSINGLKRLRTLAVCVIAALAATPALPADDNLTGKGAAPPADKGALARYVAAPDDSYSWRELGSGRIGSTEYAELRLVSHTWRGIAWKHQLFVFRPSRLDGASRQAFLYVHGGRWRPAYDSDEPTKMPKEARIFTRLAESLRAPVAVLRQVPFQPLFERTEDALIAYTFDSYLNSGEEDWPLLLPMVKATSRAMNAIQEFSDARWGLSVERFTVSGASKRGWTSWLVAAIDPRVAGVAPMVIDMLNIPAQIRLQQETFGELSHEVRDYVEINLPERIDSARGQKLLSIVDPYSYRSSLDQDKLILLATNDPYWPLDAMKLYWNGLSAPKHVLYVPNQGHGMRDYERLIGALSALHRHSARGEPLPEITWRFARDRENLTLSVHPERKARRVLAWTATSPTRDFREARWRAHRCSRSGSTYVCRRPIPDEGYAAMYSEIAFSERGETPYSLSTGVCIAGAASAPAQESAPAQPEC